MKNYISRARLLTWRQHRQMIKFQLDKRFRCMNPVQNVNIANILSAERSWILLVSTIKLGWVNCVTFGWAAPRCRRGQSWAWRPRSPSPSPCSAPSRSWGWGTATWPGLRPCPRIAQMHRPCIGINACPSLTLVFLVSVPDFLLGEEAGGLGAGVLSLVAGTARFTRDMAQLRAAAVTPSSSRAEVTLLSKWGH